MNIERETGGVESVCVYCGSSNTTDPAYIKAAAEFGRILAAKGVRLVYGGGGVGLMGACAKEILYDEVETIVVQNMHERKRIMFEQSDAFVVLPGGIGTLEEIVEMLSWKRLALHDKPMIFYSPGGFWAPFDELIQHTIEKKLTPATFVDSYRSVDRVEDILPTIAAMRAPTTPVPDKVTAASLT